jgi:predicted DNA-binding protein
MGSVETLKNLSIRADGTASIELDAATVRVLVKQAKTARKPAATLAASLLRDALEDAIDLRDARRVLARVKAGTEKTVSADEVFRRNGLRA